MQSLQGVGVLVTRPTQQAAPLCRLLEDQGATVATLPAVQIISVTEACERVALPIPIDLFDLIVFSSANAVRFGASLLGGNRKPKLAAIGPATARALTDAGYVDVIVPVGGFDSENLLSDPRVIATAKKILLVKGRGGRDMLRRELERRGADVVSADVYQRLPPTPSAAELASITAQIDSDKLQVVTATSAEIVANLLQLNAPDLRVALDRLHWLVPSARIAAAGRALGLTAPLIHADSAEDHDLVAAVVRWRSSASGA